MPPKLTSSLSHSREVLMLFVKKESYLVTKAAFLQTYNNQIAFETNLAKNVLISIMSATQKTTRYVIFRPSVQLCR